MIYLHCHANIKVPILNMRKYEKQKCFSIVLNEGNTKKLRKFHETYKIGKI
jgi:hypothetical protein